MQFEISEQEVKRAKIPHEIFLVNLVGNHILWFIAALGVAGSYWQPLALVPVFSFASLMYILWRTRRSRTRDPWFVMCHWDICARRSRVFIVMLGLMGLAAALGWVGYSYLGMMKVAVYALVGGVGILPVMVTVLILIIMESDALHQAAQKRLPRSVQERFPNPGVGVLGE
jgi:peptidoglycan biosynthesis protein MviN/MurJ (putative lipid II flippase)